MKSIIKGETLLHALIISLWLIVTMFLLGLFKINDLWPASIALLFFFEGKLKIDNIKNILCGGAVGILLALVMLILVKVLVPSLGLDFSILLSVFIFIFLIIALGDISHMFFNNYTFCYFTVALITSKQSTVNWLIALILGGGFMIAIIYFFLKLTTKHEVKEKPVENNQETTIN